MQACPPRGLCGDGAEIENLCRARPYQHGRGDGDLDGEAGIARQPADAQKADSHDEHGATRCLPRPFEKPPHATTPAGVAGGCFGMGSFHHGLYPAITAKVRDEASFDNASLARPAVGQNYR